MQSSWDAEIDNHKGPHWILTIFPNGKLILTTPDPITQQAHDQARAVISDWMGAEGHEALIIGDCLVNLQSIRPQEFTLAEQT